MRFLRRLFCSTPVQAASSRYMIVRFDRPIPAEDIEAHGLTMFSRRVVVGRDQYTIEHAWGVNEDAAAWLDEEYAERYGGR